MAYENGLLNPAFSASKASLNRRSTTSLNTITNNLYSEADSDSLYNTLQRNANNTVNPRLRGHVPVYDNIEPGSHLTSKQDKGTSPQQTSSSQKQKRQRGRRDRIIRVILMGLILFVAVIALLLAVLLVMGKIGPDCPCDSAGKRLCIPHSYHTVVFTTDIVQGLIMQIHSFSQTILKK